MKDIVETVAENRKDQVEKLCKAMKDITHGRRPERHEDDSEHGDPISDNEAHKKTMKKVIKDSLTFHSGADENDIAKSRSLQGGVTTLEGAHFLELKAGPALEKFNQELMVHKEKHAKKEEGKENEVAEKIDYEECSDESEEVQQHGVKVGAPLGFHHALHFSCAT